MFTIPELVSRMKANATVDSNGNVTEKVHLLLSGNSSIIDWSAYTNNSQYWKTINYGS